jgi:phospholipase/carboxylesterase
MSTTATNDPHGGGLLLHAGAPIGEATGALILLHGRGAPAEDILGLAEPLSLPGLAYLAPEAAGRQWYPDTFLARRERNEPWLSSALKRVGEIVDGLIQAGIPSERIAIGGFSQGACLTSEFAATHPRRYAGLLIFTGGLIGPPGSDMHHPGDLAGTPVFLANGDADPHIPWERTLETDEALRAMGAVITMQQYLGRPHTITMDEIGRAKALLEKSFL